jgi:hypothetical protein
MGASKFQVYRIEKTRAKRCYCVVVDTGITRAVKTHDGVVKGCPGTKSWFCIMMALLEICTEFG